MSELRDIDSKNMQILIREGKGKKGMYAIIFKAVSETLLELSRKFRGKFLFYLKRAYYSNALKYTTGIEELTEKHIFESFIDKLYKKEWIVYCKPPFGSAEHVLEYLGRYTHRVAISNHRIVNLENGFVTFKWRDYKDNNKEKLMTLTVDEFIRRFLMHVLPRKFVKIRHYGILSNRTGNHIASLKNQHINKTFLYIL